MNLHLIEVIGKLIASKIFQNTTTTPLFDRKAYRREFV